MSKFDSELAERLYELSLDSSQDEECGSVQENGTWYGLFREEQAILSEDSQGFVSVSEFDSDEALEQAWQECLEECGEGDGEESEPSEPDEDDYTISDARGGGYSVAQSGKWLGDFRERDEAEEFIRSHGNGSHFWPNVWVISDHGNAHLIEFAW